MVEVLCCSSSLGVEPVHGRVISFVENEKETTKKNAPGGPEGYLLAPSPLIVVVVVVPFIVVVFPLHRHSVLLAPLLWWCFDGRLVVTSLSHGGSTLSLVVVPVW
jgi:hypothetical protein